MKPIFKLALVFSLFFALNSVYAQKCCSKKSSSCAKKANTETLASQTVDEKTAAAQLEKCPLKGTEDCPLVKNCPKRGTAECPYKKSETTILDTEPTKESQ